MLSEEKVELVVQDFKVEFWVGRSGSNCGLNELFGLHYWGPFDRSNDVFAAVAKYLQDGHEALTHHYPTCWHMSDSVYKYVHGTYSGKQAFTFTRSNVRISTFVRWLVENKIGLVTMGRKTVNHNYTRAGHQSIIQEFTWVTPEGLRLEKQVMKEFGLKHHLRSRAKILLPESKEVKKEELPVSTDWEVER